MNTYTASHEQVAVPLSVAKLLDGIKKVTTPQELDAIVNHPDANEAVLLESARFIMLESSWTRQEVESSVMYSILMSDRCTDIVASEFTGDAWGYYISGAMRHACRNGLPMSEVALFSAMKLFRVARESELSQWVLKQPNISDRILALYVNEYRVTLRRLVAKSSALSKVTGEHLLMDNDAEVRRHAVNHDWVEDSSLYLLRDDPNDKVSQAARKAISKRGLPEGDEIDNVMEDEVSLFFLSGSDDPETLARLAANKKTPESILRSIVHESNEVFVLVAGNTGASTQLLEELSVGTRDFAGVSIALAGNPSNSGVGLKSIAKDCGWDRNIFLTLLRNPNCPASIVEDRYFSGYGARIAAAAINTGFMSVEQIDGVMKYQYSNVVFKAVVAYKNATVEQLTLCHNRGSGEVSAAALERLVAMGVTFPEA